MTLWGSVLKIGCASLKASTWLEQLSSGCCLIGWFLACLRGYFIRWFSVHFQDLQLKHPLDFVGFVVCVFLRSKNIWWVILDEKVELSVWFIVVQLLLVVQ